MSLLGVGIAAVVGDLGGQALADFLAPHVFGAGVVTTTSSVEDAAAEGQGILEASRLTVGGGRYVGFARFRMGGANTDEVKVFDDETKRDRWWAGVRNTFEAAAPVDQTDYASLVWARWVDNVTGELGPTLSGTPEATFAAGPMVPDASSAAFKVFTFASKALVGGATYAVGVEIGAFK